LPNDEWTKGKCGMKGLLYMSVGKPAVMSNVGMNRDIIENGVNGFLPVGQKQWVDVLSELIEDKSLRKKIGENGRKTVIDKYSKETVKKTYLDLYTSLMN
jgi:glycosyltransferase involved in cell wall biosynthesis